VATLIRREAIRPSIPPPQSASQIGNDRTANGTVTSRLRDTLRDALCMTAGFVLVGGLGAVAYAAATLCWLGDLAKRPANRAFVTACLGC
jgi:hypothetical protein